MDGRDTAHEGIDKYDAWGRRTPNTTRADAGGVEFRSALQVWKSAGNDPNERDSEPLTVSWPIDDGLQTVTKNEVALRNQTGL